jgi:hypothetical protein
MTKSMLFRLSDDVKQEISKEMSGETFPSEKKNDCPPRIIKASKQLFQGSTLIAWSLTPNEFKEYGLFSNNESNDPVSHYKIELRTKDGSDVVAVFKSTGELIRYNLINKNAPLPAAIRKQIKNSHYRDWKIASYTKQIKNNHKNVVEHLIVKLEKRNINKTFFFSNKGEALFI